MLSAMLAALLSPVLQLPSTPQFPGQVKVFDGWCFDFASWDLTGDGRVDLLLPHSASAAAQVEAGDGQGGFTPAGFVNTGGMGSLEVGDLDHDGLPDLLCFVHAYTPLSAVAVVKGQPGGTFAAPKLFATSGPSKLALLGDMDGDGSLDAVVASASSIDVCLNAGSGDLGAALPLAVPGAKALALGDFDLDGKLDAALFGTTGSDLGVLLGQGDGTLVVGPVTSTGQPNEPFFWSLHTGDMNEDGRADLVGVTGGEALLVLDGQPGATFSVDTVLPLGHLGTPVLIADLDEDGHTDVAFGRYPDYELDIALGDGAGHLGSLVRMPVAGWPDTIGSCDADGDGHPDLVVIGRGNPQLMTVLLSPGCGVPESAVSTDVPEACLAMATADMDGDQIPDLVSAGAASLVVLKGDGAAAYAPFASVALADVPSDVAAGDLDGDGLPDAVVLSSADGSVSIVRNLGGGTLGAPQPLAPAMNPRVLALSDCNGDGSLEIIAGCTAPAGVDVWRNDGDGNFLGPAHAFPAKGKVLDLAVGDVTGDGLQDVVAAGGDSIVGQWSGVMLLDGDASHLLQTDKSVALSHGAQLVGLGDVDADGDLDIVAKGFCLHMYMLANLGGGVLQAPVETDLTGDCVDALAVADLDGDGRAEMLCFQDYHAPLLRIAVSGAWKIVGDVATGAADDHGLLSFDADGDGDLDLLLRPQTPVPQPSPLLFVDRQLGPWFEVGPGLAGPEGTPELVGAGALAPGHLVDLSLCHAPPGAVALLVAGSSALMLPFHGGVFVPAPNLLVGPLPTGASGSLELSATWPAGVPSGLSVFLQAWLPGAGGTWTASEGLVAVTP